MKKKALMPISSVLVALFLALVVGVFSASPFGEREVVHAQTAPELTRLSLAAVPGVIGGGLIHDVPDVDEEFDPKKMSYTARVANANESINVTATFDSGTVTIDGESASSTIAVLVDLSVGRNNVAILLEEGTSRTRYTVTVTRATATASKDTNLRTLSLRGVTLSPTFDPGKTVYSDTVPNTVLNTVVAATAANSGAVVDIRSPNSAPAAADGGFTSTEFDDADSEVGADNVVQFGLADTSASSNYIAIRVTAADVFTTKLYTVTVTRAAETAASGANLSALGLTGETLSPAMFDGDKTAYTARVSYSTTTTTVTLTVDATDSESAMTTITSDKDDDIGEDNVVELEVGANVITIKVDAANAIATKTYTVTVTRASATASADTNLSSLNLSNVTLSPAFDPGKAAYSDTVPNSVLNTVVAATAANSGATVEIKSAESQITALNFDANESSVGADNVVELVGTNPDDGTTRYIAIKVTAADGVNDKLYTVTVTRAAETAASGANLSALGLTGETLSPAMFDGDKTAYTARVPYSTTTTTVTLTVDATDSESAMTTITSDKDDDIGEDNVVELEVGANVITIKVDAANAIATKTYTVTVTRASATASADTNLSSLDLSNVTLLPAFDPGEDAYDAFVPNSVSLTTVRENAADAGAVVAISAKQVNADGTDATPNRSSIDSNVVTLAAGYTEITVTVTAENAVAMKPYTVTVNRAEFNASDNASLVSNGDEGDENQNVGLRLVTGDVLAASLVADDLYLNMPFSSSRTDYTTTAERSRSSIIVATSPAMGARVVVSSNRDDEVTNYTPEVDPVTSPDDFNVDLEPGINVITIKVTAENAVTMRTYTVTVTHAGTAVVSSDATLQALTLSGITLSPAFNPGTTAYTAEVEDIVTTTVEAMATHLGATVAGTGERSLSVGDNRIRVTVTAEDGTSQTYTVTVTVLDEMVTPSGDLLDRYDADDSDHIDLEEVNKAIDDFFAGELTLAQVNAVIDLFFE